MPTDSERIEALEREVARQAELINALARHTGMGQLAAAAVADGRYPDVIDALNGGRMIEAIKLYRGHAGVGLKDAKDAVEALARGL